MPAREHSVADIEIVPVTATDEPALWEMLRLAAQAEDRSLDDVRRDPELARYVDGWGRAGDSGVKAVDPASGVCVGAAWLRLWRAGDHGYGYIDEHTPELSIAVVPDHQGTGIGTRLLEELVAVTAGAHAAISLSVRRNNTYALRLYRRLGFEPFVTATTEPDDSSITMRRAYPAPQ